MMMGGQSNGAPSRSQEGRAAEEGGKASAEPGEQVFVANGCGSCHTFAAAGTNGTTGPDLNEYLAPDDNAAGIEEMIVDPEAEIAEGYSGGIMPHSYGESIPKEELEQLVQFLVNNSPAGGEEEGGAGGSEEEDIGGPTK
jgi:cytochrome c551/c552